MLFGRGSKLEFQFEVEIKSLNDVTRLDGQVRCKLRLLSKNVTNPLKNKHQIRTHAVRIRNHQAVFNFRHTYIIPMTTSRGTTLDAQYLRVSVRVVDSSNLQAQSGKLGFRDINLAELTPGLTTRNEYLLGYKKKDRQDNSRIIVNINMKLMKGDPMSFTPAPCSSDNKDLMNKLIGVPATPAPSRSSHPVSHLQVDNLSLVGGHSRNPSVVNDGSVGGEGNQGGGGGGGGSPPVSPYLRPARLAVTVEDDSDLCKTRINNEAVVEKLMAGMISSPASPTATPADTPSRGGGGGRPPSLHSAR